eukprot:11774322-Alexandrium_andersonii.AAC.1
MRCAKADGRWPPETAVGQRNGPHCRGLARAGHGASGAGARPGCLSGRLPPAGCAPQASGRRALPPSSSRPGPRTTAGPPSAATP